MVFPRLLLSTDGRLERTDARTTRHMGQTNRMTTMSNRWLVRAWRLDKAIR